jgi:DNA-binding response OmpR family regulator
MPDGWRPNLAAPADRRYLQKPFDYRELVEAIEHLLVGQAS